MKEIKLIPYGRFGYLFNTFGGYHESIYSSGSDKALDLCKGYIVSARGICNHYKGETK